MIHRFDSHHSHVALSLVLNYLSIQLMGCAVGCSVGYSESTEKWGIQQSVSSTALNECSYLLRLSLSISNLYCMNNVR